MSNPGRGSKSLAIRLAVLLVLAGAAALALKLRGSPLTLSEQQVSALISRHELIGLSLDDAAARLQHKPVDTVEGSVVFDFAHIRGWTAGPVVVDVRNGKVVRAAWQRDVAPGEE